MTTPHAIPAVACGSPRSVFPTRLTPEVSERIRLGSLACSLLVCFGHSYLLPQERDLADAWMNAALVIEGGVKHGLARVSTPFFFIVAAWLLTAAIVGQSSGWWLVDGPRYRTEIGKRIRSLALPFAIWSGLSFLTMVLVQTLWPGLGLGSIINGSLPHTLRWLAWDPVAYPLWFIRNLFALAVAAPLLLVLLSHRVIGLGVLGAFAAAWFTHADAQTTRAVLFFSVGVYAALHPVRLPRPSFTMRALLPVLWVTCAGVIAWSRLFPGGDSALLRNLSVLLGLASLWWSLPIQAWMRTRPVQVATGFTFFIYVVHEPLASIAKAILRPAVDSEPLLVLVGWLLVGSLTFMISLLVGFLWERWLPASYAVVSGGRAPRRIRQPSERESLRAVPAA